jgi:hypothetical protein
MIIINNNKNIFKLKMENPVQEENELMYIYEWVDSINLSRPKKNIARDFSDGGKYKSIKFKY